MPIPTPIRLPSYLIPSGMARSIGALSGNTPLVSG
jgi:hypothetical protein